MIRDLPGQQNNGAAVAYLTKKVENTTYDPMLYGEGAPGPHAVVTATNGSGTHTFTYDANGNMLQEYVNDSTLVNEYQYDADGLTSYRSSPGEGAYNYLYDPDGSLEWKRVPSQNRGTFDVGGVYEEDLDTGEVTRYYYSEGQRIAMRKNGTLYYLTEDHLGGTALVTDAAGQMVGRVRYYPYGGIRSQEGTLPTDKLFTGQQRETTNGIYHYNARMYDADIGRMPQADTIVPRPCDPQAYNRYSYVENNPVMYTDPSGHFLMGDGGSGRPRPGPIPPPTPPPVRPSPPPTQPVTPSPMTPHPQAGPAPSATPSPVPGPTSTATPSPDGAVPAPLPIPIPIPGLGTSPCEGYCSAVCAVGGCRLMCRNIPQWWIKGACLAGCSGTLCKLTCKKILCPLLGPQAVCPPNC